jgi:hypothetical protein
MQWGVFEVEDSDVIHVAPCDGDEPDTTTHILSDQCFCHPWYDEKRAYRGTRPLLIHDVVQ